MARFPVVGIGTSAGGLQALQQFFEAMPADAGMAFVIVQHLDPTAESHLAEVLGRSTAMPVVSIQDGMRVKRNHVYTIVPNRYVRISGGVLHLEKPSDPRGMRSPIDVFFRSLAEDLGEHAICLVLSGAGTNGTAGVRAIKGAGGLAIAQDPATAQYPAMPISASTAGMADSVLGPQDMPKALLSYARTGIRSPGVDAEGDRLDGVLSLILARTGQDFRGYKRSTLTRRIYRRMGLSHTDDPEVYLGILRDRPEELNSLVRDLLINVTSFFRDGEAWEALRHDVVVPLLRSKKPDEPLRIWVPACATGEEAYSIGMLVLEEMHSLSKTIEVKIFATDAEQEVVSQARAALYPASIAADVSPERLSLYFDREGDFFRVRRILREMLTFAPHNILRDPPFSHMDLVSCRNVLIYLEPTVQRRVTSLLHFALREGGYLFLSTAENVTDRDELFEPVSKKWHIYRRVGATRHDLVDFSAGPPQALTHATIVRTRNAGIGEHARSALADLFAPPSVVVDQRQRILLFHGDTAPYLRQPSGEPTDALLALAREGLRTRLRAVLQQARHDQTSVSAEVRLKGEGRNRVVRVEATPLHGVLEGCFLVSFVEEGPDAADQPAVLQEKTAEPHGELEEELRSTRAELRATVEQLEVSNEELKASNEEITSMNEELQSTNEELETSKEELQSVNEELTTVNAQLQSKVSELEERTNDLNNLLKATDIATLFLDVSFRIRGFTPAMTELLNVIPSDIGRPLEHLSRRFDDPELSEDAVRVLQKLVPKEAEVRDDQDRWYIRRVVPYRTDDNRIAGVVVTFVDITERRASEQRLQQAKEYAERILSSVRHPIVVLDRDLRARGLNAAFSQLMQLAHDNGTGQRFAELAESLWNVAGVRQMLQEAHAKPGAETHAEVTIESNQSGHRIMQLDARRIAFDSQDLIVLGVEDVTERRAAERHLRFVTSELLHRVRNILGNVRVIAAQSREHADSLSEFWESFSGRLDSLASIHGLLAISRAAAVRLEDILLEELRTYSTAGEERYQLSGPAIELKADAAQTLAMLIHELTTNSAKYGALSVPQGRIDISWKVSGERVRFDWVERGVTDLRKPERRGFGTLLIEEGVPYTFGGTSRLSFHPDGVACSIEVPLGPNIRVPNDADEAEADQDG